MAKLPSLKNLTYLLALHQHQNFNRAAQASFVSQSTLSSGIQNLEEQLGCQLIERDHKSFLFTAMGEEIVDRARNILTHTEELVNYAQSKGSIMEGPLRVGCIPTIGPFLLGRLTQTLRAQYPKLQLHIREDTTQQLLNLLRDGELDMLILAVPVDIHGNQQWVVGRDPFKFVVHPKIYDQLGDPFDYNNLPDQSIFLLEREHCLSGHAVTACRLGNTKKINPFTASSIHSLVQMAESLEGATFMPQLAIDQGILDNSEMIITNPVDGDAYREIGVVFRPTTSRRQTFRKVAETLAELMPINTLK
ncbi:MULTISPECIES: hydrogen peroxide-inducible genes activator [Gammaproteobacteria]|uniref:hydrogen peroxide-inducible genes activator n=1 Tax=Gammaproteobacteria TaxID=1236 RepID=UPI000DD059BF|nr:MULTISPECIES: hydrogen peroxide-inducible genes activator [Gammaproteobacteria]RTE86755.1 hydrogen peroxide-inducible genes activator [Aliidiomarina sp. B3213]TCZ90691.1 hydrogen peroxide-inducible genes activator [Lysobacter sp. N42]